MRGINKNQYENLQGSLKELEFLLQDKLDAGHSEMNFEESILQSKVTREKLKNLYKKYLFLLTKLEETIGEYNEIHLNSRNQFLKQVLKEVKGDMNVDSEGYEHYKESVSFFYGT